MPNSKRNSSTIVDSKGWIDQLEFQRPLRHYQSQIIELCNQKLKAGERELHIVAPPGAGKTIIGLQIISQFRCPSLVLCPNSTIQSQWAEKLRLFFPADLAEMASQETIGTHEDRPLKPITVLTYQALSVPGRESDYLDALALRRWIDELARSRSLDEDSARARIEEIKKNNPKEYEKDFARHQSRLRQNLADLIELEKVLHDNALQLIDELKAVGCGLVIFDECHHLTDYWAAVMIQIVKRLDKVIVVGLTGTPPEGKSGRQQNRYMTLVGEIDYQVATPALVKEGGLAPFQDLVYLTEPTEREREFLRQQHSDFRNLLHELSGDKHSPQAPQKPDDVKLEPENAGTAPLSKWVSSRTEELAEHDWNEFVADEPALAIAMARYLWTNKLPLPKDLQLSDSVRQAPLLDDWIAILEDFSLNKLKVSGLEEDQQLFKKIAAAVRKIGYSLSERGIRKMASNVDRVLAYSESKARAVAAILETEFSSLEEHLRAVVVTDYEKMSPTAAKAVRGIMDEECGGAYGVLHDLLRQSIGEMINPCLVTGSGVMVDSRVAAEFLAAAHDFFEQQNVEMPLQAIEQSELGASTIAPLAGSWTPRVYVPMATALFERGLTKCLVGTRGIFAEGWDSQQLNTVIDLTTSTSPVSVKQLRGRGIRLNTSNPSAQRKVANNWDVACIAPELEKGLNDYLRFVRKHEGYYGISDDGQIECGVGHVHPAFSELTPAEVFSSIDDFNEEMLKRALVRDKIYDLWQIGKPYANKQLGCVEISRFRKLGYTPPNVSITRDYAGHARKLRSSLERVWWQSGLVGIGGSAVATGALLATGGPVLLAVLPLMLFMLVGKYRHLLLRKKMSTSLLQPSSQNLVLQAMANAVFSALKERKLLPEDTNQESITITLRSDRSFRVFLDHVEPRHAEIFVRSFQELLAPLTNQPYVIPKYEYDQGELTDRDAFLDVYMSGQAKPEIGSYHPVPKLLARSEKGRDAFERAWNQYVSPGFILATEQNPEVLQKYFGMGPSLSEKLLWE